MENTPDPMPDLPPAPRHGVLHRVRNYFLTGLVVTAPLAITTYLVWSFIGTIDGWITPLIPHRFNPETYLGFPFPGLGLILVIVVLTILGALTANIFGRFLLRTGEKMLARMPIVRSIYSTLKQIFETVVSSNSTSFQDVVLVEYPRPGLWAIGFVSAVNRSEIQRKIDGNIINVFLPTTPNPTSGFLLFSRKEDLIYLDMTVDEGVKYVISAGLVSPQELRERAKAASQIDHVTDARSQER